ncbi:MAG: class fructose-bisphosphate aldolase [Firmicutes bacterium]|nr:class fructose-bisphosphate aldolase [Bacillota bacterium]
MLLSMDKIIQPAMNDQYGVPAPNIYNMETVAAVFEAAGELRSPLIIAVLERYDLEMLADIAKIYSGRFPQIPAALHLDHGNKYESIVRAIRTGFTSVMIDRSQCPFDENVRETKEIVKMAHAVGVSVEAELGHVGMGVSYQNDPSAAFTQTEDAVRFVQETGVDCLAIAIGTAHGRYAGTPQLDFPRLKEIRSRVSVPLVLHGGSSTGDDNLVKAIKLGITKLNVGTDLFTAGINAIKQYFEQEEFPVGSIAAQKNQLGYKQATMHYMTLLGSHDKF